MKKLSINHCKEIAKQRQGKCLSKKYVTSRTKYLWKCKKGHEWKMSLNKVKNQGSWCPFCAGNAKLTIDHCKEYAVKLGGVCLSKDYTNNRTPMKWRCREGHVWHNSFDNIKSQKNWCPHPSCVSKKKKSTSMLKYGVDHPMKNRKVALKNAKAQNNTFECFHWKTGEILFARGSYEKKVIEWLNLHKINFCWQIEFDTPNNTKYFVDLYLIKENKYVEIKGYMRDHNKIKWEWFHKTHPNSELWNKEKLKELKIL